MGRMLLLDAPATNLHLLIMCQNKLTLLNSIKIVSNEFPLKALKRTRLPNLFKQRIIATIVFVLSKNNQKSLEYYLHPNPFPIKDNLDKLSF